MVGEIVRLIRLHSQSSSVDRIQRLIVLAVKKDAGKATAMDLVELEIIQQIRKQKGDLPEPEPDIIEG